MRYAIGHRTFFFPFCVCVSIAAGLFGAFSHKAMAQPPVLREPRSDSHTHLAQKVLGENPTLYFYLCENAFEEDVLRASRKPLMKPSGRHPDAPAALKDIVLPNLQSGQRKEISALTQAHNDGVPEAIKQGKISQPKTREEPRPSENRTANQPVPARIPAMLGGSTQSPRGMVPTPVPQQFQPFPTDDSNNRPRVDQPPAPPLKDADQGAYVMMLDVLSQTYSKPENEELIDLAERVMIGVANGDLDEPYKRAAGHILSLRQDAVDRFEAAKRSRDAAIASMQHMKRRALAGDYVREERYQDGDTTYVYKIDENASKFNYAESRLRELEEKNDTVLEIESIIWKYNRLNRAKMRALKEFVPLMTEKFSGPVSARPIVGIHFVPEEVYFNRLESFPPYSTGYSERFQGKYVAKNQSGQRLTHVTMAVDFYHFSTIPDSTTRHVYYFPEWAPGEEKVLSRHMLTDLEPVGKRYGVPSIGHINDPPHQELDGMAGTVKTDIQLWANEAQQKAHSTIFPERAESIAPLLLHWAEQTLTSEGMKMDLLAPKKIGPNTMQVKIGQSVQQAGKAPPTAEEFAKLRMATYLPSLFSILPESHPYQATAREYLFTPKESRERLGKGLGTALVAACAKGKAYQGTFSGPGSQGTLNLLFTDFQQGGKTVRAELRDENDPSQTRPLGGYLLKDPRSTWDHVLLFPLAPTANWSPPDISFTRVDPLGPSFISLEITEVAEGKLKGIVYGQADGFIYFDIAPVPSTEEELNAAEKRFKENRKWKVPLPGQLPKSYSLPDANTGSRKTK